jgi:hypothetical protein
MQKILLYIQIIAVKMEKITSNILYCNWLIKACIRHVKTGMASQEFKSPFWWYSFKSWFLTADNPYRFKAGDIELTVGFLTKPSKKSLKKPLRKASPSQTLC